MILNNFIIYMLTIIAFFGKETEPKKLNTLTLEIQFPDHVSTIKFSRVNRVLANEHLPVWVTTKKSDKAFKKLRIMNQVGKVSFFHDTCSKSSLVFYHKRKEIDGVIGTTYYIKRFRINKQAKVQHVNHRILHTMDHYTRTFNTEYTESIDDALTRSQRCLQKIFYVEMLIVINYKTFRAIEENSELPPGVATVSHVLTVNNAADLIYQLLETPKIQLNIAGIVIESIPNQWTFETGVTTDPESETGSLSRVYVKVDSMHINISDYFWLHGDTFPRYSYDVIQYLTTSVLKDSYNNELLGQTKIPFGYNNDVSSPNYWNDCPTIVVQIFESYKYFIAIAHEIAHVFSARHDGHDKYGYLFNATSCGDTIMADRAICSESCLKWSPQAYAEFANYFSNHSARCNLLNYPRSLDVPKPKLIHSVAEQCECYGYEPPDESHKREPSEICDLPIKCKKKHSESHVRTILPMDGTPCGVNKVCWNEKCTSYKLNFKLRKWF